MQYIVHLRVLERKESSRNFCAIEAASATRLSSENKGESSIRPEIPELGLIKTRCSSDSKIPGDSRSCTRDSGTRFDQDPVQFGLEVSRRFEELRQDARREVMMLASPKMEVGDVQKGVQD